MNLIENFENMLASGKDDVLLRYGLGQAYLKAGNAEQAAIHLRRALEHDAEFSAAWKSLGKALTECGDNAAAMAAYASGIETAERKGDIQAAKEMRVFLKRLQKTT
jgi:predicted Zn-dependent protease